MILFFSVIIYFFLVIIYFPSVIIQSFSVIIQSLVGFIRFCHRFFRFCPGAFLCICGRCHFIFYFGARHQAIHLSLYFKSLFFANVSVRKPIPGDKCIYFRKYSRSRESHPSSWAIKKTSKVQFRFFLNCNVDIPRYSL